MPANTTTNDLPEESLRCEYGISVFGRFTDVLCVKGGFDLPLALGKGCLGKDYYQPIAAETLAKFIRAVCSAFREIREKQEDESKNNPPPASADQQVEPSKPLHERIHKDDVRVESVVRLFGRDNEIFCQNCDFNMLGALKWPGSSGQFSSQLTSLVITPAQMELREFFDKRRALYEQEQPKRTKEPFVDSQPWNFGSENLTRALEQEQKPQREAA